MPGFFEVLTQFIFCGLCEDFGFFTGHYLLHNKHLYSRFHKKHHEYSTTVGLCSEYMTTVDFILSGILPSSLGPLILGSKMHLFTYICWIIVRISKTTIAHSGY